MLLISDNSSAMDNPVHTPEMPMMTKPCKKNVLDQISVLQPQEKCFKRAKEAENTRFQILSIFSILANPVRTSTRPQTSSKACDIISGLFGGLLMKETHIKPKNSQRTVSTSSTQKCLFWGILPNLVHRGSRLNIDFQPK